MIKRIIVLVTATAMAWSLCAFAAEFTDMPEGEQRAALEYAVENGILKGDGNRLYPERSITRAEMAAVLVRALGLSDKADISGFSDVKPDDWYYETMEAAVAAGIFEGDGSRLLPQDNITREQAFAVVARAYAIEGNGDLSVFGDGADIADWARVSAEALLANGVISDKNKELRPKVLLTRAEAAQLLYNISLISDDKTEVDEKSADADSDTETEVPKQRLESDEGIQIHDISVSGDGEAALVKKVPADSDYKLSKVTLFGKAVTVTEQNNTLYLDIDSAKPGLYTAVFTDEKYEDITAEFTVDSDLSDADIRIDEGHIVIDDEDYNPTDYVKCITSVTIGDTKYTDKDIIFNEDGSIIRDARSEGKPVFAEDGSYELIVEADGYNTFTLVYSVVTD